MALEINEQNYDELVKNSNQVVLLDFWAQWCGPCRAISPIIEELSTEFDGKAVVGKVDVDNNQDIANNFKIRSIPTILFIKNGEVVDRFVGATTKNVLKDKLEKYM
jgi:thioredoxin 1